MKSSLRNLFAERVLADKLLADPGCVYDEEGLWYSDENTQGDIYDWDAGDVE